MPPKTSFSIPLGDTARNVTQPKKTKRGVRATEEDVPLLSSKGKKSGKASGSRHQADIHTRGVEAQASEHPTLDTEESHPLQSTEMHDEESQNCQTDPMQSQSNVSMKIPSHIIITYTFKKSMDQWLQQRSRYLHLLLEMEGLTKA
jgi:hypothetical protein